MKNVNLICIFGACPIVACFNKASSAINWAKNCNYCNYKVVTMPKNWADAIIKMVAKGNTLEKAAYTEYKQWCELSSEEREETWCASDVYQSDAMEHFDYAQLLVSDKEAREAFFA